MDSWGRISDWDARLRSVDVERVVATTAQAVNRFGGRFGEALAGRVLTRIPSSLLPSSGMRHARRGGFLWELDLAEQLQRTLYFIGSYDALTVRVLKGRVHADDIVLDVGANIGTFALPIAAALASQGRVVAVEPAGDTARRLRHNIQANGLRTTVVVVEAALSDRPGQAVLRETDESEREGGRRTLEGHGEAVVGGPVLVTTVDLLRKELRVPRFDVVKIDVEGHEQAVLRGMTETFRTAPPRLIIVEVRPSLQERAGSTAVRLIEDLQDLGYRGDSSPRTRRSSSNLCRERVVRARRAAHCLH